MLPISGLTREELQAECERLQKILDNTMQTLDQMAEGIAMLSHPNWTFVDNKDEIVQQIVVEWLTRSAYERIAKNR